MDPNTGDIFYRARNYDPYSQKFLSEDPIGFSKGELNLYAYVGNNPLIYSDPYGTVRWMKVAGGVVQLAGGAITGGLTVAAGTYIMGTSCGFATPLAYSVGLAGGGLATTLFYAGTVDIINGFQE